MPSAGSLPATQLFGTDLSARSSFYSGRPIRQARPRPPCALRLHNVSAKWILREEFGRTFRGPVAPAGCSLQPNRRCLRPDHIRIAPGWSVSIRPWVERWRKFGASRYRPAPSCAACWLGLFAKFHQRPGATVQTGESHWKDAE